MNNNLLTNFSELSQTLTKTLTKREKSNNGIFFTPPSIINKLLTILKPF
jgi:hypothetical protein